MKVKIVTTSVFFSHLSTWEIDFQNDETFQFTIFSQFTCQDYKTEHFSKFQTNFLFKFQFFILVALFAVAAADSYKAAEYKAPKYEAPKAPKYEAPKYETPKYESPKYEEVTYVSYN
jgi:hypothetical protein